MPSSWEGLAVALIALLPGALAIFGFERVAGRFAIGVGDRLLRFIGASAVLYTLLAPATYLIWHGFLRPGSLGPDERLPLWLWPVAIAYVALPLGGGLFVGRAYDKGARGTRFLGARPPSAWDAVFEGNPRGWILLRLKSGRWVGGLYHDNSFAGGFPEPADLFLEAEAAVDQQSEDFVVGGDGEPLKLGRGLLVRWEEVEYLEFS